MPDLTSINLYTGNSQGAIGDFTRQYVPTGFSSGQGAGTYSTRFGGGETLTAVRSANGSVSMTITAPGGEELLAAAGSPQKGQGLTTFRMFGSDVPHTDANAQLAIGAMQDTRLGNGFRAGVNVLAGKSELGGYAHGADFEARAKAGTLRGKAGGVAGIALAVGVAGYEAFHGNYAQAAETAAGIVPGGATAVTAARGGDVVDAATHELGGYGGAVAGGMAGAALGAMTGPAAPVAVPVLGFAGTVAGGIGGSMIASLPKDQDQSANHSKLLSPEEQLKFGATLDKLDALPSNRQPGTNEKFEQLVTLNKAMKTTQDAAAAAPGNAELAHTAQQASSKLVHAYQDMLDKPQEMASVQEEFNKKASAAPNGNPPPGLPPEAAAAALAAGNKVNEGLAATAGQKSGRDMPPPQDRQMFRA